jgi:predicted ester cyclase
LGDVAVGAERLVAELVAAFNAHDLDAGARLVVGGAELLDVPSGEVFVGPEGLRQMWSEWLEAFPDASLEVVGLAAADDGTVTLELIGRGTHAGPFAGPGGRAISPTGQLVAARFCKVASTAGARILGERLYYDRVALVEQLGAASWLRAASGGSGDC